MQRESLPIEAPANVALCRSIKPVRMKPLCLVGAPAILGCHFHLTDGFVGNNPHSQLYGGYGNDLARSGLVRWWPYSKAQAQDQWVQSKHLSTTIPFYMGFGATMWTSLCCGGSYRRDGEQNIVLTSSGDGLWTRRTPPTRTIYVFQGQGSNPTWIVGDLGYAVRFPKPYRIYPE